MTTTLAPTVVNRGSRVWSILTVLGTVAVVIAFIVAGQQLDAAAKSFERVAEVCRYPDWPGRFTQEGDRRFARRLSPLHAPALTHFTRETTSARWSSTTK